MTTVKINGKDFQLKVCPSCGGEVITLIREFQDGKVVRTFCHLCYENPESRAATVARKLHEHAVAGTLDEYPLEHRLADLEGKPYAKPNGACQRV